MIRHVIIWTLRDDLSDEDKKIKSAEIKEKLEALRGVVDGLTDIKVHIGLLGTSNADIMLESTFESREALAGYQVHPEHLKAAAVVKSAVSHRSCADFEV